MPYTEFTLEDLRRRFGITVGYAGLFPGLAPVAVPEWLGPTLARGSLFARGSEKARSEFIVAPVLLAAREAAGESFALFSGQRLSADPAAGLDGECDYILSAAPPSPVLQSPLVCIVEAKKNDIEAGLGQCAAQMLGAARVNERDGADIPSVHGCVTTGEVWQFLRLTGTALTVDTDRFFLDNLPLVLAALLAAADAGRGD